MCSLELDRQDVGHWSCSSVPGAEGDGDMVYCIVFTRSARRSARDRWCPECGASTSGDSPCSAAENDEILRAQGIFAAGTIVARSLQRVYDVGKCFGAANTEMSSSIP